MKGFYICGKCYRHHHSPAWVCMDCKSENATRNFGVADLIEVRAQLIQNGETPPFAIRLTNRAFSQLRTDLECLRVAETSPGFKTRIGDMYIEVER